MPVTPYCIKGLKPVHTARKVHANSVCDAKYWCIYFPPAFFTFLHIPDQTDPFCPHQTGLIILNKPLKTSLAYPCKFGGWGVGLGGTLNSEALYDVRSYVPNADLIHSNTEICCGGKERETWGNVPVVENVKKSLENILTKIRWNTDVTDSLGDSLRLPDSICQATTVYQWFGLKTLLFQICIIDTPTVAQSLKIVKCKAMMISSPFPGLWPPLSHVHN